MRAADLFLGKKIIATFFILEKKQNSPCMTKTIFNFGKFYAITLSILAPLENLHQSFKVRVGEYYPY
jgi:hypothetical protein